MRRFICVIALLSGCYTSFGQLNDFNPPFNNSDNIEPSRSQFVSYRRTSGTKGSPIDPNLSFSAVEKWVFSKKGNVTVAEADLIVPFEYMDKALFLNIGATKGAIKVFVNEKMVGQRTDSKLSSEFYINKFVERGLNKLKVIVEDRSDVDKIEQSKIDETVLSGVYLFVQPKIRIFDITTRTSLDPTYKNGLLEIALLLKTELLNKHDVEVYYDLFDASGKLINQASKQAVIDMRTQDTIRFTASIMDVHKWSHEDPYLYTVEFKVKREGRWTETMWRKIGFRTTETIDKKLVINGNPTKIIGLNAQVLPQLINPNVDNAELAKTLYEIKMSGVNAIRTPFPLKSNFYEVCDSVGLYVFETANINAKNTNKSIMKGGTLANDPAWKGIFVERVVGTYERAKVYPSVITIGLGDDAGNGYNMYKAYEEVKKRDDRKLIVYNDAKLEWNTDINMFEIDPKALQPTVLAKGDDFSNLQKCEGVFLSKPLENIENLQNIVGTDFEAVTIESLNPQKGVFRITNNMKNTNLSQIDCKYYFYNANNGKLVASGKFNIELAPGLSSEVELKDAAGKKVVFEIGKVAKFKN